jgi:hypothetical protein
MMKDVQAYIESGILEVYCLGTLSAAESAEVEAAAAAHPEIEAEIGHILQTLEQYPVAHTAAPAPALRGRVLDFLNPFLAQKSAAIDLNNPPILDQYSDPAAWRLALEGVEPDVFEEGFSLKVLSSSPTVELCVVWLSDALTEDAHDADEFGESFLLLEGACECDFDGQYARYSVGDFFNVPANTRHVIRNVSTDSPFVKGLVQRLKKAA